MCDTNDMLVKQWANAKEEGGGVAMKQSILHMRGIVAQGPAAEGGEAVRGRGGLR